MSEPVNPFQSPNDDDIKRNKLSVDPSIEFEPHLQADRPPAEETESVWTEPALHADTSEREYTDRSDARVANFLMFVMGLLLMLLALPILIWLLLFAF